jgi:hypothetical protein
VSANTALTVYSSSSVGFTTTGNIGIGTTLVTGALINIGGACATQENISLCIGKGSSGIACVGYCTGALGTCSACTCC